MENQITPLECKKAGRKIGNQWLFREISLRVLAGHIVGLIGPSGGGKSSLLRSLAHLDDLDEGYIEFFGVQRVCGAGLNIYPDLSFVSQGYPLWPHLSVGHMRRLVTPELHLESFWSELGLESLMHRRPAELSFGQRQRVGLALALSAKPKVLLLDEISSAQDIENSVAISKILRHFTLRGGAIVLSTHQLEFAVATVDQFLFLDSGSCIEEGNIARLRNPSSPRLRNFFRGLLG